VNRRAAWLAVVLTCSTAACAKLVGLEPPSIDDGGVPPDAGDADVSTAWDATDGAPGADATDGAPDADATMAQDATDAAPDGAAADAEASTTDAGPLSLSLSPAVVHLLRGQAAALAVTVDREGYAGDLHVELQGLPTGVTATGLTIAAGSSIGTLALSATTSATLGPAPLTVGSTGSAAKAEATLLVQDASGTLDTTFGVNGVAYVPLGLYGAPASQKGMRLTQDGHIILCGNTETSPGYYATILARLSEDGVLDTTFGATGSILWDPDEFDVPVGCGVVAASGRIVIGGFLADVGQDYHSWVGAAFTSNGSLDTSYAEAGIYEVTRKEVDAKIVGVAVGADGRMAALGFIGPVGELALLMPDGQPDLKFGGVDAAGSGMVSFPAGVGAYSVDFLSDGQLMVLAAPFAGGVGAWLERYSAGGTFDTTYGDGGSGPELSISNYPMGLVLPDDSVVVAGLTATDAGATGALELAHFQTNGAPDPAFGDSGAGTTTTNLPGGSGQYVAMAVGADGRIATALTLNNTPGAGSFWAAVFTPTGALDTSFGGGFVSADVGPNALANNVAIDALGRVLVAGGAADPMDSNKTVPVVVRFWP
jgi:uncharacterized delta-60 repeat protein